MLSAWLRALFGNHHQPVAQVVPLKQPSLPAPEPGQKQEPEQIPDRRVPGLEFAPQFADLYVGQDPFTCRLAMGLANHLRRIAFDQLALEAPSEDRHQVGADAVCLDGSATLNDCVEDGDDVGGADGAGEPTAELWQDVGLDGPYEFPYVLPSGVRVPAEGVDELGKAPPLCRYPFDPLPGSEDLACLIAGVVEREPWVNAEPSPNDPAIVSVPRVEHRPASPEPYDEAGDEIVCDLFTPVGDMSPEEAIGYPGHNGGTTGARFVRVSRIEWKHPESLKP